MISLPDIDSVETGSAELQWQLAYRKLVSRKRQISLTPTECQLITPLWSGGPVAYADLATRVYHCRLDPGVRVMLDKHIDRIRGKLRGSGMYIYCVLGYGYILLPEKDLNQ